MGRSKMRTLGIFSLHIQPGDVVKPARIKVMAEGHIADQDGRVFITPECISLAELEGQINALQDDLDQLRARAKRAFQHGAEPI